jgi:hypothetical protein
LDPSNTLFLFPLNKGASYRHVEWTNKTTLDRENGSSRRIFLKKWHDGAFQPVPYEQYEQYTRLDRIVTQHTRLDLDTGEQELYYLCKWQGLNYRYCNWEKAADIEKVKTKKDHLGKGDDELMDWFSRTRKQ